MNTANLRNRATLLNRLRTRLFPRPPTQWPQYAHDCGWAPTAKEPLYPFNAHNLPPQWQYKLSQGIGGLMWFWIFLRWKEDAAHEIFVRAYNLLNSMMIYGLKSL